MSSDEEDYMSDKFLFTSSKDVRPSIKDLRTKQRELGIPVKRVRIDEKDNAQEYGKKEVSSGPGDRAKPQQEFETSAKRNKGNEAEQHRTVSQQDRLQEGLSNAITSDNKGFAILAKMGYKQGQALGKQSTGILEPIRISMKSDRAGLGREAALQDFLKQERTKQKEFKIMAKRVRINEESKTQKSKNVSQQEKLLRNSIKSDKNLALYKMGQILCKQSKKTPGPIRIVIKSDRVGFGTKAFFQNLKHKRLERTTGLIKKFEISAKGTRIDEENRPEKSGRVSQQDKFQEGRSNTIGSETREFDILAKMDYTQGQALDKQSTLEPKIKSDIIELDRETALQNYLKQKQLEIRSSEKASLQNLKHKLLERRTTFIKEFEIAAKRTRIDEENKPQKSGRVSQQDKLQEGRSNTIGSETNEFDVLAKMGQALYKRSTLEPKIKSDIVELGRETAFQNYLKQKRLEIKSALIIGRTEQREFEIAAKRSRLDEENWTQKSGKFSQYDKPEECVSNAITSEYKGFAMLSTEMAEPINILIKSRGRGVVAPQDFLLKQKRLEIRQKRIEVREKGTEMNMIERFEENFLESDLGKWQRDYENLNQPDKIETPAVDWLWSIRENTENEDINVADNKAENWDTSEEILELFNSALRIQ